jgi:hypothetical protein
VTTDVTPLQPATKAAAAPVATEHDVFHDPTGRRWRKVQYVALLLVSVALIVFAVSCGPIFHPPPWGNMDSRSLRRSLATWDKAARSPSSASVRSCGWFAWIIRLATWRRGSSPVGCAPPR